MEIEDICSGAGSSSDINMANPPESSSSRVSSMILGGAAGGSGLSLPKIDENNAMTDDGCSSVKRLLTLLDQLDTQVENFRKDILLQQDKKDAYLMSLEVIKNSELMNTLDEYELEEIGSHLERIGTRLATIDLSVKTIRNISQEDSLNQINVFIDSLIVLPDKFIARQKCQSFLHCFESSTSSSSSSLMTNTIDEACATTTTDYQNLDSQFFQFLNGCTLDDRKKLKKRLLALMAYLNKQTISD